MKQIYITCTGCSRRKLDCEKIKNYFIANGFKVTETPEAADYIFISTCGLSDLHENESIQKISYLKNLNADVIVYGCLPLMNSSSIENVFNGEIIHTKDIERIDDLFSDFTVKFKDMPDANIEYEEIDHLKSTFLKRHIKKMDLFYPCMLYCILTHLIERLVSILNSSIPKVFTNPVVINPPLFIIDSKQELFSIRISSGCMGNCSYCNIKLAIGKLISKPTPMIIEEIRSGLAKKQYRYNIISSDTGSYGKDIGSNLPNLLNTIFNYNQKIVIEFIQDLHPYWICHYKSDMIELIKKKRIKSMLTAVQSGSKRILKLMNRNMDIEEFVVTIGKMKKAYPRLRLRTQVIAGFPTETDEEFQDTINLVKKCGFDEVDIFQYVERKNMASAGIEPKISNKVVYERIRKMKNALPPYVITHVTAGSNLDQ